MRTQRRHGYTVSRKFMHCSTRPKHDSSPPPAPSHASNESYPSKYLYSLIHSPTHLSSPTLPQIPPVWPPIPNRPLFISSFQHRNVREPCTTTATITNCKPAIPDTSSTGFSCTLSRARTVSRLCVRMYIHVDIDGSLDTSISDYNARMVRYDTVCYDSRSGHVHAQARVKNIF